MEEQDSEESATGGGWLVSYADLMTLLFAAFVVLYGITPQGESEEILGMASSIRESFMEIPDEIPEENRSSMQAEGRLVFQSIRPETVHPRPLIKRFNRDSSVLRDQTDELDEIEVLLREVSQGDGVQLSLRRATRVERDEFGVRIKLMGTVYFPENRVALTAEGKAQLLKLGKILKNSGRELLVSGHTAAGLNLTRHSNLELSALRAGHVRRILIEELGMAVDQVLTAGYGDLRPVGSNATTAGRQENQRVEILIRYQGAL